MTIHRGMLAAVGVAVVCLSGCKDEGLATVPVYGAVSFPGREQPRLCQLFFRPLSTASVSRPTIAEAEADGSYDAKAFQNSEGLIPGKYQVTISYFDLKPGGDPDVASSWVEKIYDAGELNVDAASDEVEHNITVPAK